MASFYVCRALVFVCDDINEYKGNKELISDFDCLFEIWQGLLSIDTRILFFHVKYV